MEHDIPFGNSNRENGPTFLDFPLFLGIFQWDKPTKRVPFTVEPEIPEILTKWKAPYMTRKTVEFFATAERPYMIITRRKKEPVLIYMTCRKKEMTCSLKLLTSMLFALDTAVRPSTIALLSESTILLFSKHFSFCRPLFLVYTFQVIQEIYNLYKSCYYHRIHNYLISRIC